jgi:conjugative relaxase-like TrwC/TraI family protein
MSYGTPRACHLGSVLSITRITPGAGLDYLLRQVARGKDDFQPGAEGARLVRQWGLSITYHADPKAHGETPGRWAGDSTALFGVHGAVTDAQAQKLIGLGQHPLTGEQLGRLWRRFTPMADKDRKAAVEKAWQALPKDATYEQIAAAWIKIWTAPERHAVAGFDVTVSPVKSVSLLWAFGNDTVRREVLAAHHAGVQATIAHLRAHGAFTRLGTDGVRQVDVAGVAVMVFDHRMSRDRDPQLHSHIVFASKVAIRAEDGSLRWLSLDAPAFFRASIGARSAYERAVEVQLGTRLGVRFGFRPGSRIREIIGIPARSITHYSKRRVAIEVDVCSPTITAAGTREWIPPRRWRRRAQIATLATRRPKGDAESTRDAVRRWRREDQQAGLDTPGHITRLLQGNAADLAGHDAQRLLYQVREQSPDRLPDEAELIATATVLWPRQYGWQKVVVDTAVRLDTRLAVHRAVTELAAEHAVFTVDHLELAIGRTLAAEPASTAERDWAQVKRLAAEALNTGVAGVRVLTPPGLIAWDSSWVRVSDGQSVYTRHRELRLTTEPVLRAERQVIGYATRRGATPAPPEVLDRVADQAQLTEEKRRALHAVGGDDRRVVGVVGPAGTGKTYLQRAVGMAAGQAGIPVLGLAVSQNAAEVLAAATRQGGQPGIRTENVAMWLHAQHHPPRGTTAEQWAFAPGQWVILDEASQASSLDLARLIHLLAAVGGKLILVGDPAQIPAVGPGGLFEYLAALGHTVTLTEVHRFTQRWEGPASLRLRVGDMTVLADYDRHARIHAGHRHALIDHMLDAWTADVLAGHRSLLIAETGREVAQIAGHARTQLVRHGLVPDGPTVVLADGTRAGVADRIVTRENNRRLTLDSGAGKFVANRDQWSIVRLLPDGGLLIRPADRVTGGVVELPAGYVTEHVQLAYACTVDSIQGRTVDLAHALVDSATALARLYVMLTRGKLRNDAYVVAEDIPPEGHKAAPAHAGIAVLSDIMRRDDPARSATETHQRLWSDVDSLGYWGPVFDDLVAHARVADYLTTVRAAAGDVIAERLRNDPAMPALAGRLEALRHAGYDPHKALTAAVTDRELHSADDIAAVLSWRLDRVYDQLQPDPQVALHPDNAGTHQQRIPRCADDLREALWQVAAIADRRVTALAEQAATRHPAWASPLGPVPTDTGQRERWLAVAQRVITYRDRYPVRGDDPIGPEPVPHDPIRWGTWYRAHTALGVATLAGQMRAATHDQLITHLDDARLVNQAAPTYAAGRLRVAHIALLAAQQHHQEAHRAVTDIQPLPTRRTPVGRDVLGQRLHDAATRLADQQQRVAVLEHAHQVWLNWYQQHLPTRHAGLAAAHELAVRAHHADTNADDVLQRVRATAAQVRAVTATQPQPQARPVPPHLPDTAAAGRGRAANLPFDPDTPPATDPDIDLDTDLS